MRRKALLLMSLGAILCPFASFAADESGATPVIVNTGAAYVAPNSSGTTMFIPKSIVLYGASSIYVAGTDTEESLGAGTIPGKMVIGGSVYQSTTAPTDGNGFSVDATTGKASGKGIVSFTDVTDINNNSLLDGTVTTTDKKRFVTAIGSGTYPTNEINTFNRAKRFVAFPKVEIATADTIIIPGKMGIDANSITRSSTGIVRLKSEVMTEAGKDNVYDASLRIVGTKASNAGVSSDFVPQNVVWVERNVGPYRLPNANAPMGFAAPYNNLRSGYFAGNYVRSTQGNPGALGFSNASVGYDPATGHVGYIYANKKNPGTGKIDKAYYLVDANDQFKPSVGYVLNLRPQDFDYQDLIDDGGLSTTNPSGNDASQYNRNLFVFGKTGVGGFYWGGDRAEQLFAQDKLYTSPILNVPASNDKFINWVIGNSYTSGIDIGKLATAMKSSSTMTFGHQIFIWPAGSSVYQPYDIADESSFNVLPTLTEIPTQSLFILQLVAYKAQAGSFTIDKSMLTHGDRAHNEPYPSRAQGNRYSEEVLFKVTPKENQNIYDLTLIGFRAGAKGIYDDIDLEKAYSETRSTFQLYSVSDDNVKLSGNALSNGTINAPLKFEPSEKDNTYIISVSRLESLTTEIVWLEDIQEGKMIDLRATDEYEFISRAGDSANRFKVHFSKASAGIETSSDGLNIAYDEREQQVVVSGLKDTDKGSLVIVADAQGRIVRNATVSEIPQFTVPVHLVDGVYIATLKGNRNLSKKFIVKPNKF